MNKSLQLFTRAGLLALTAAVSAYAADQCPQQNATLNGTYALSGSGTIIGVGPIGAIGLVQYNGDGTGVLVGGTNSINGVAAALANLPITFTVNRDCTGTKTIGTGPSAFHFNFVITPDGQTLTFIETDNGVTMTGTATRVRK
jgi:hypothetical protein